jgi:hypothetical protein
MQAGSFDRRCRRVTHVIVLLAAAGIFAAPSAMAQIIIDPAPTADAGGPYTVAAGGTVQLSGTFGGAPPIILLWTVSSGSLSDPTIPNPVFSAVGASSPVTATFTVTTGFGSATSSTTITVASVSPPVISHIPPITIFSGEAVVIHLSSADPVVPIVFTVVATGAPALVGLTVTSTGPSTADVTFTAPLLPLGQVTSDLVALTVTATNAANVASAPEFTTVTVLPLPDKIFVISAQYRTNKNKLRLDVTATSSVISPNVVLALQPYLTVTGATYDPSWVSFTNTGGGQYTLTLVGVPEPAVPPATPIQVRSNLGGVSPPFPVSARQ